MTTLTPPPRAPRRTRSVAREALVSDEAAAEIFNTNVGAGGRAYDDRADVWLVPDPDSDDGSAGRAFWIYERAGTYYHAIIPAEWVH